MECVLWHLFVCVTHIHLTNIYWMSIMCFTVLFVFCLSSIFDFFSLLHLPLYLKLLFLSFCPIILPNISLFAIVFVK